MKNEMITYYELLGLVKDGKAPKKVRTNEIIFEWDGKNYKSSTGKLLTYQIYQMISDYKLPTEKCIEIIQEETEIKQIEKIPINEYADGIVSIESIKINELIDTVNKLIKEKNNENKNV